MLASSQEATLFRLQHADEQTPRIDLATTCPPLTILAKRMGLALSWLLDSNQAILRLQGYLSAADLLQARAQGGAGSRAAGWT